MNERSLGCAVPVRRRLVKQKPYCARRAWALPCQRGPELTHSLHWSVPLCTISRSTGSSLSDSTSRGDTASMLKWERGLGLAALCLGWNGKNLLLPALLSHQCRWDGAIFSLSLLWSSSTTMPRSVLPSQIIPNFPSLATFLSLVQDVLL